MFKFQSIKDFIKEEIEFKEINSATIFQDPYFLDYHGNKFNTLVAVYNIEDIPVCFISFNIQNDEAFSHRGASYGGFVQLKKIEDNLAEKIITNFILELKNLDLKNFFVRFPPEIFLDDSVNTLNKVLKENMIFRHDEETTYVDLTKFDIDDLKSSNFRRNHIRDINNFKQNKDIIIKKVKTDKLLNEYYRILLSNLSKFNETPTHSIDELKNLLSRFPNDIEINLLAVGEQNLVGITKFKLNNIATHIFYGSMDYTLKDEFKGALKYLYAYEMNLAKSKNLKYFNFGIDVHFGEEPNINLRNFKLGFGGLNTKRQSYFLKLN